MRTHERDSVVSLQVDNSFKENIMFLTGEILKIQKEFKLVKARIP